MVHLNSDSRRMAYKVAAAMKSDGLWEIRQLLEVRLGVWNLASVDLLPDGVCVLNKQDIRSVQADPRGK